ncbi:hypothetical protein [Streptomyces sp. NPDC020362]
MAERWSPNKPYDEGARVQYDGSIYVAQEPIPPGLAPGTDDVWQEIEADS